VRLQLRFIAGLKDALRLVFVGRLEAGLNAGDFVFQVEDAPRALDQTECVFHGITHGYECDRNGIRRVSELWTSYSRTKPKL